MISKEEEDKAFSHLLNIVICFSIMLCVAVGETFAILLVESEALVKVATCLSGLTLGVCLYLVFANLKQIKKYERQANSS